MADNNSSSRVDVATLAATPSKQPSFTDSLKASASMDKATTRSDDGKVDEKLQVDSEQQADTTLQVPDGVLTGARLYLVFLALMLSVFVSGFLAFPVGPS